MKIDNFGLIIGTMKGGTTSLFNYLAQHPQVCPCSNKEPDFFLTKVVYLEDLIIIKVYGLGIPVHIK